jgi:uncharacterized protein YdhG (YjbR/CyaY superfamily)
VATHFESVDQYIASFPDDVRPVLEEIRGAVREALPGSGETIRYDMPTVTLDGRSVVHYAGWKKHVSVYPVPELDEALEHDVAPYRAARATARFPLNRPVPVALIARLAVFLADRTDA